LFGLVWCFFFARWFTNRPSDHPSVNAGERELLKEVEAYGESHADVPWGKLVSNRSVLLLWAQYWFFSFTWYFYITWLPTYLHDYHRLSMERASFLAILPLLFGGFGSMVCGLTAHRAAQWMGSAKNSQKAISAGGFLAS